MNFAGFSKYLHQSQYLGSPLCRSRVAWVFGRNEQFLNLRTRKRYHVFTDQTILGHQVDRVVPVGKNECQLNFSRIQLRTGQCLLFLGRRQRGQILWRDGSRGPDDFRDFNTEGIRIIYWQLGNRTFQNDVFLEIAGEGRDFNRLRKQQIASFFSASQSENRILQEFRVLVRLLGVRCFPLER